MKNGKRLLVSIIGTAVIGIAGISGMFNGISPVKADEQAIVTSSSADFDPNLPVPVKTSEELHQQEEISVSEMEAYMSGAAYQSFGARATGKITGSMTNAEYQSKYAALNVQQNEAWNQKYNFRPETNVVTVSTYTEFRNAYTNNAVSKIILAKDILSTDETTSAVGYIHRTESIEIDGRGYRLHLLNGSINVENLTSLASFEGKFSDVPVFHMHDIQPTNGSTPGQLEAAPYWAFVNGAGSLAANTGRRFWQYRIGNIYTPHGTGSRNSLIRGRLIGGNQANISVWGHNTIVTASENFYTGGVEYEPFTYHKGEIAVYDYSTIWFIRDPNDSTGSTGTGKFIVGEGSFVYLNNTGSGINYPGVYEHWTELTVGKDATFNVNVPGVALYFNKDNAAFTGQEGSTVNLLSRSGSSTVSFRPRNVTHGSQWEPNNTKFEMLPTSNLFVVGNRSTATAYDQGVITYGNLAARATSSQFILDNLESFDIRNTATSNNAFLGDSATNRGQRSFTIKNSDISIWNTTTDIDGAPTYDYADVTEFKVTTATANGTVTSTNSDLASQYNRTGFKRISGMNSTPELIWVPVTDADYAQKSKVLIGYTAVGGSDPFDENGDAKVKPVYADATRKAYVDYVDTKGNTYTGVSTSDNYIHWTSTLDAPRGNIFQTAGVEMKGTPYRATIVNGTITPYRTGVETVTTVIDVTPPEPATVIGNKVTNGTKQLLGENLEPNAKVLLTITGTTSNAGTLLSGGTVGGDGTWTYNLTEYLNPGDTVTIYLQDNAGIAAGQPEEEPFIPAAPATNSADGNINPFPNDLTYRDAVFKKATQYVVSDAVPTATAEKTVVSSGGATTSVGDVLTYTLTTKNTKSGSENWTAVQFEDTLAAGLEFDENNHGITINGTAATSNDFEYDQVSRKLTIKAGNIGADQTVVITFDVTVNDQVIGQEIKNKAKAIGYSPQEDPFVAGPIDPSANHTVIEAETSEIGIPGILVYGILSFKSAPDAFDFGLKTDNLKDTIRSEAEVKGSPLVVNDSRGNLEEWKVQVTLTKEMTNGGQTLTNVLKYKIGSTEHDLVLGTAFEIFRHTNTAPGDYDIKDKEWDAKGDGFIFEAAPGSVAGKENSLGKYTGDLLFTLSNAK